MDYLTILLCGAIQFLVFSFGIYVGTLLGNNGQNIELNKQNTNNILQKNKSIIIDDKKLVLDIKTDGMQKKFDNIADELIVESDISASVNKLKSMKG